MKNFWMSLVAMAFIGGGINASAHEPRGFCCMDECIDANQIKCGKHLQKCKDHCLGKCGPNCRKIGRLKLVQKATDDATERCKAETSTSDSKAEKKPAAEDSKKTEEQKK